jgi:hypothetical protein
MHLINLTKGKIMKFFILALCTLGLSTTSFARDFEVNINGSVGSAGGSFSSGTDASVGRVDNGTTTDTSWNIGVDVLTPLTERMQVGGTLQLEDPGAVNTKTAFQVGGQARYNFHTDIMNAPFADIGLSFIDVGDFDWVSLNVGLGKRFAITESIAWTPNLQYSTPIAGDRDEGYSLIFNLVSFSGFIVM